MMANAQVLHCLDFELLRGVSRGIANKLSIVIMLAAYFVPAGTETIKRTPSNLLSWQYSSHKVLCKDDSP